MLKLFLLLVLTLWLTEGRDHPCLVDEQCGVGCVPTGLRVGKCLDQRCVCVHTPGKRALTDIIDGACVSDQECQERCKIAGYLFGRCLTDVCHCYSLL